MHTSGPTTSPENAPEPDSDNTIQLLVRMPDGTLEQVDVAPNAPIASISAALPDKLSPGARYSFANVDLDPDATLLDANIADAYAHANSLLNLIDSSSPDPETKAAALDSACAVVERISNGIKSMSALCAAAASEEPPPHHSEDATHDSVTPEQLARSLTTRLPRLFAPEDDPLAEVLPPPQPSISSIRDARRAIRESSLPRDEHALDDNDDHLIGQSTNGPLPRPPRKESASNDNIILANSGKTTWLDDVKTTWEVDTVRQSGVLSSSKMGLELDDYLRSLEQSLPEQERISDGLNGSTQHREELVAGDSSDDDHPHSVPPIDAVLQQNTPQPAPPSHSSSHSTPSTHLSSANGDPGSTKMTPSASSVAQAQNVLQFPPRSQPPKVSTSTSTPLHQHYPPTTAAQPSVVPSTTQPAHALRASIAASSAMPTSPSVHSSATTITAPLSVGNADPSSSAASFAAQHSAQRQAARIAPAPQLTAPSMGNGMFGFSGVQVPLAPWAKQAVPQAPLKKKRGRKRKNPELTDEERILWRKQQNRESAKLSRVRRKVIAAEYEGKLNALINENTMLKKQVDGLENRLAYMQSLLTVSVKNPQPMASSNGVP
ncbi:hypothetical protein BWQ96_09208 [Gracilariopsis chorda]|uniref:BZIP domain-containing protein n=1 Tax=Gracilariopsis chorda TaxID=448386 RepID=A0A2V3IGA8_9FLOR|nr:hypothetical protein BWQ96_09208 [Gracilariopsis chorda]|eukprot:PXF41068.1 hypothetical protein BWQ96_09208 [Gracilariopsis chorda]